MDFLEHRENKNMEYEPIKHRLESYISLFPLLRKGLYRAMDMLLLRQRYIKREIASLFPKDSVLALYDAGAGFCQYSDFVLKNWPQSVAFATDLYPDSLVSFACYTDAYYQGRFSYRGADLAKYHPLKQYDLALAIDILEHIEDDLAALRNFHQALKENGYLIISTPSDTDEAAKFTAEHVRPGYARKELEAKLKQSGFTLVKSIYTYGFWGKLSWKLLMKYPLKLVSSKLMLVLPLYYLIIYPISELLMQADLKLKNRTGTGLLLIAQKAQAGKRTIS